MSKPTLSQAFAYLFATILGLYFFASLLSLTFFMSEWNILSKIAFWGISGILLIWTLNDFIINTSSEKSTANSSETILGNDSEPKNEIKMKSEDERLNDTGNIEFTAKNFENAIDFFTQAININPQAIYYHNRADSYYKLNDFDSALEDYYNVLAINPTENYRNIFSKMGDIYYKNKEFQAAVKFYSKALKLSPEKIHTRYNLALAFMQLEEYDNAILILKSLIDENYNTADIYISLATIYFLREDLYKLTETLNSIQLRQFLDKDFGVNEEQFTRVNMLKQMANNKLK